MIDSIGRVQRVAAQERLQALAELAQVLPRNKDEIEPWLLVELGPKSKGWIEELESALSIGRNAAVLLKVLPPFYEVLGVPDHIARTERLRQRAIQLLIKDKQFTPALEALRRLAARQLKLEAVCHEGLGDFRSAAECYREAGQLKEALNCYRSIPDLEAALKLVTEIGEHPASESLQWISRLQTLVAERPEKFTKVVTAAEKKLLEELLERSLGVTRRKPVRTKAGGTKKAAPKKRAPKKAKAAPF